MFKNFCFIVAFLVLQLAFAGVILADDITSPEKDDPTPGISADKPTESNDNPKSVDKSTVKAETDNQPKNEVTPSNTPIIVEKVKVVEPEKSPFSGKVRFRQQFEDPEGGAKKPRWRTRIRGIFNFLKELTDFNLGITLRTGTGISDSNGSYSAGNSGNIDANQMSNFGIFVNQAFIAYKSSDTFWWVAGRYDNSVAKSIGASIFTSEISFESLFSFDGMSIFAKPVSDVVFWFGVTPFLETKHSASGDYEYTVLASTQISYSGKFGDNKLQIGAGFWGFLHPENLPEIETGYGYGFKAGPDGNDEYLTTLEFFATYSVGSMLSFKFHCFYNFGATDDPLAALFHIGFGKSKTAGDFSLALQLMYIERYSYYYKLIEFGVNFRGFQFGAKYVIAKNYKLGLKIIGGNKIISGSSLTGKLTIKLDFEASFK